MQPLRILVITLVLFSSAHAAEPAKLHLTRPLPFQVVQREGFIPQRAGANEPGGPALGFADVTIAAPHPRIADAVCEARAVPLDGAFGRGADWKRLELTWRDSASEAPGEAGFSAVVRVPAGGWYRLEVRLKKGDETLAAGNVEPLGVGEVFLIAGQSYATNTNEERLRVTDKSARVAAFDSASGVWKIAHDPQPTPDGSDGGSIWPALGDLLLPSARVPIGFANVAVGGTSSGQWLPEGKLHPRLVETGRTLGKFRAVLWQQGESDVIGKISTAEYVRNVKTIRAAAVRAWQFEPPWLLAKSTLHPTVYIDPAGEDRIRRAIDELCKVPGFAAGPDTDTLGGENRGGLGSRRHFSALGQRHAAALWFAAILPELNRSATENLPPK